MTPPTSSHGPATGGSTPGRPTWIQVDAAALANNVHQIRRIIGPKPAIMAVVKANAYGHGAVQCAPVLLAAGVQRLAVATVGEAVELREAGVQAPILVLGFAPAWQTASVIAHRLMATVYDWDTASALAAAAADQGVTAQVHVKVNTGMNRLGVSPQAAPDFLAALATLDPVEVEGIFSHFATSDDADKGFALEQFAVFDRLLRQLESAGLRPPVAHMANSAALLTLPQTRLDAVRPGIALYGLHPDVDTARLPAGFQPALQWKAQVAHVLALQPGDSVSYGREFIARRPMAAAVLPVGYADGFPRRPFDWGSVLIHGQPAPLLGRVCMDQIIVDVTAQGEAGRPVRQGDEAVLIGLQGEMELTAEEIGRRLHTINYDVVSRILGRVPRVLVNG